MAGAKQIHVTKIHYGRNNRKEKFISKKYTVKSAGFQRRGSKERLLIIEELRLPQQKFLIQKLCRLQKELRGKEILRESLSLQNGRSAGANCNAARCDLDRAVCSYGFPVPV